MRINNQLFFFESLKRLSVLQTNKKRLEEKAMPQTNGKIFAIGDIHGCHNQLNELLERLPYEPKTDTLVFLGDYINRGEDSASVIERVCRLRDEGGVVTLLGNHERLLLEYQSAKDPKLLPHLREEGIEATLKSYGQDNLSRLGDLEFMPAEHGEMLKSLIPYWETDSYIFVHAGFAPGKPLSEQSITQLTGMRDFHHADESQLTRIVVFGHIPFLTPFVKARKFGVDTGAVYGNMLTAIELPDMIFYHA